MGPGKIGEGLAALNLALSMGVPGPYVLKAAIGGCHARSTTPADTNWRQIASLYTQLGAMTPSPVIALNHAVAVAMANGPEQGLAPLDWPANSPAIAGCIRRAQAFSGVWVETQRQPKPTNERSPYRKTPPRLPT
jgi:predicted RNA polymerase sigma factor